MTARVEVLTGPGTAIRYGELTVWAGPTVSGELISFLQQSARNVATSTASGARVVEHVAGILVATDPEPGAPFAVFGPTDNGWVILLHGPVQAWDGAGWYAPTPNPGWLRADVVPRPAVSIGPAGGPSPRLAVDSPLDLGAGMVPGGGVIVLPGAGQPLPTARQDTGADDPYAVPDPTPSGSFTPVPPLRPDPATEPVAADPVQTDPQTASPPTSREVPGVNGRVIDLRQAVTGAKSALPFAFLRSPTDRPDISGIRCPRGHFNRPGTQVCSCCGLVIPPSEPQVPGPRPVLGVLLADDGTVYRVARDLLIGADPSIDQAVASGSLQPLILPSHPGLLAPAHTELRLHGWTLRAVDRGSASGTFAVAAGTSDWVRLDPYTPADITPGTHLSLGQRVLTYLSPWR